MVGETSLFSTDKRYYQQKLWHVD